MFNAQSLSALVLALLAAYYLAHTRTMHNLASIKAANAQVLKQVKPVAVVVGGTNGIGAAMALKLAQYSKDPEVHIVGRSQTSADEVIQKMKDVNPGGKYSFHKVDASLLSSVRSLTSELRASVPSITHLVLSPGILSTAGRTETPEGNDVKMMLHYYSRFLITRDLLPNLSENAKVMSVLDSKRGDKDKIDWNDLDLKKGFSLGAAAMHCMTLNDMLVQRLAASHPSRSFIHSYPSLVSTSAGRSLPAYARAPANLLSRAFGTSAEDCAEWLTYSMNQEPPQAGKPRYVGSRAEEYEKKLANDTELDRAWSHSEALVDKV